MVEKKMDVRQLLRNELGLAEGEVDDVVHSYDTEEEVRVHAYTALSNERGVEALKKNDNFNIYFSAKIYDQCKDVEAEMDQYLENPCEVVEGALQCTCGSKKVYSHQVQTRGLDETATTFAQCSVCGRKWRYSG